MIESARRWYQANRDKAAESATRWRQTNPDKVAEKNRRYRQVNPDKVAEWGRQWRRSNPDKAVEWVRRWNRANPEKRVAIQNRRRTRKTQAGGSYTAKEWMALCKHYGNRCLCCNRTDAKLTADHILPVVKGGGSDISNIQPLCGKCNSSKGDKHIDYRPDTGPVRWVQKKMDLFSAPEKQK